MTVYGRAALDTLKCAVPGCGCGGRTDPLVLSPRCHPDMPVRVEYFRGVLMVTCAICTGPVAAFAVEDDRDEDDRDEPLAG